MAMAKLFVKRIGVSSLGKIMGVLYAFLGFIIGAFLALFSLVGAALAPRSMGAFGALFGVGAIVALPIIYGILGFLAGCITAFLYNLVAGWVGGLEMDLE
jgi:hypothetical protein